MKSIHSSHIRRPIVVSVGALLSVALVWPTMGAFSPMQDGEEGKRLDLSPGGGEIVEVGPVNVYSFRPTEHPGPDFEPAEINMKRIYEVLGPTAQMWHQHVMTLSNPYFEGRAPGLEGNMRAAAYLEFYFKEFGLEPAFPAPQEVAASQEINEEPGGANRPETNNAWTSYRQPFTAAGGRDTVNVGGVLRGQGALADEWIVIGAHFDHVGYGNRRPMDKEGGTLHPGADDNASGTSAMLMLAQRISQQYAQAEDGEPRRSILFMGFSAEEMGLVGSRFYTRNSTIDAEKINIMLNLDMIGRLRDETLLIGGTGSAEGLLEEIKPHIEQSGLKVYADPNGRGPSDHSSFYGAGVPVLFFFTGTHEVYHRPGDWGYTVNPVGAARIIELAGNIATDMATRTDKLAFTEVQGEQRQRRTRVSLGLMPDWNAEVEKGIVVDRVFDDSSAKEAGIQAGDVIVAWNGETIEDARFMFTKLRDAEAGDTVTLTILRDGEERKVKVTLEAR